MGCGWECKWVTPQPLHRYLIALLGTLSLLREVLLVGGALPCAHTKRHCFGMGTPECSFFHIDDSIHGNHDWVTTLQFAPKVLLVLEGSLEFGSENSKPSLDIFLGNRGGWPRISKEMSTESDFRVELRHLFLQSCRCFRHRGGKSFLSIQNF